MRNKWYVAGIGLAAGLSTWGAVHAALGTVPLLAFVPAALAVGLVIVAVRVARAGSFALVAKPSWDDARPPAVLRWLKERADHAEAIAAAKPAVPLIPTPKPRV